MDSRWNLVIQVAFALDERKTLIWGAPGGVCGVSEGSSVLALYTKGPSFPLYVHHSLPLHLPRCAPMRLPFVLPLPPRSVPSLHSPRSTTPHVIRVVRDNVPKHPLRVFGGCL